MSQCAWMGPVLLVDDDDDFRDIATEVLTRSGFDVVAVSNGRDALERLAASPTPCMILLDLHMHDVSGFEVLATIERRNALDNLQVLLVSGAKPANMPPGVRWLPKPFGTDELVNAVAAVCRRRSA